MKSCFSLIFLFAALAFLPVSTQAEAPPVDSPTLEVVSSSGVTLNQDGESTTLAAGDELTLEDLEDLEFGPDAELRLRGANGQIYILTSAADVQALVGSPLFNPDPTPGSTQMTFAGSDGTQTEDPNPNPQPKPQPEPEPEPEPESEDPAPTPTAQTPVVQPKETSGPATGPGS